MRSRLQGEVDGASEQSSDISTEKVLDELFYYDDNVPDG